MGCQHGEKSVLWLCFCCCLQELDSCGAFAPDEGIFSMCWWRCRSSHTESKYLCPISTSSISLLSKSTLKFGAVSGRNYLTETGMVCSDPCECACGESGVVLVPFRDEHVASPIEICSRRLWMGLPWKGRPQKQWWRSRRVVSVDGMWQRRFSRCQQISVQCLYLPRWEKYRKDKGKVSLLSAKEQGKTAVSRQCFKPAGAMLLVIPEMWLVVVRVNRDSESFFYNYCSDLFSFMSCCWHFICFSSPHLWHYPRCSAGPYILSWTVDLHQKIWVWTITSMCEKNLSIQWKSVLFFHGNKYENIFPISAAGQSHKLIHITLCVSSSSMPTHCGQKLLRTHVLTGRNTTELCCL